MNLTKLFETQRVLDERIMEQHHELKGQNNLDWKILALQVELGECANEWRGFKKWSNDQEPRSFVPNPDDPCKECDAQGYKDVHRPLFEREFCGNCDGVGYHFHNPLLEEYVDCLHFVLSIGLEMKIESTDLHVEEVFAVDSDINKTFSELIALPTDIKFALDINDFGYHVSYFEELLSMFIGLGKLLGFTWEQVEKAYYEKNAINHERQESGY